MKKNVKGILLCAFIGMIAYVLGDFAPVIGGPVFGILIGMAIGLFFKDKRDFSSGIIFSSKKILQYAVILLGFGLNLKTILKVGSTSLPVIISTISIALIVAYIISRALKIDYKTATLIGVGSSICGGSAIAATAPVIDADDHEIAQAISVIFLFNVIAAVIFPSIGDILGFTNEGFALFAGTAVNDTSSVTAAASVWDSVHNTGSQVLDNATIVKLTRTLAIIPITFCLGIYESKKNDDKAEKFSLKKALPTFIIYFIICSLITTLVDVLVEKQLLSSQISVYIYELFKIMKKISKFFIIIAMVAIGLNTNIVKLIKSGGKPIVLGVSCWVAIIIVSIGLQKVLGIF